MAVESVVDPMIGRILGSYQVTGRIGAGGMATVYRAIHGGLDQERAVKILPPHLVGDRVLVERFSREARTAAQLRHPNIVQIYDVGSVDGVHFIAMELVAGRSLEELVRIDGPMAVPRVLHLLGELASALDAAHANGVVHRDVKPSNAIVGPNDHLTLVDFGIARAVGGTALTGVGVIGTPEYMAPELLRGEEAGPSVDQYALGIVAYELLTGRRPFRSTTTPAAILYSQVHESPPRPRQVRPELPEAAEAVLLRQLAKHPTERYPTSMAFVEALTTAVGPWAGPRPAVTGPTNGVHVIGPARRGPASGSAVVTRPRTLIPSPPSGHQMPIPPTPSRLQTALPPVPEPPRSERVAGPPPRIGQAGQPSQRSGSRVRPAVFGLVGVFSVLALVGAWFTGLPVTRSTSSSTQATTTASVTQVARAATATVAQPTVTVSQPTATEVVGAAPTLVPTAAPTSTAPPSRQSVAPLVPPIKGGIVPGAPNLLSTVVPPSTPAVPTATRVPTSPPATPVPTSPPPTPAPESISPANAERVGLMHSRDGSPGEVWRMAFGADGETVAAGSTGGAVMLWRIDGASEPRSLEGHADAVTSVAISPDGQIVVSGSGDKTVKLWRVSDGALLHTLNGHGGMVISLAFSPDGQTVASGSWDKTAKLWRVSDGSLLRTLEGHLGQVTSVSFSPDGQTLASGSWNMLGDSTVKLWRVRDGATLRTLKGHAEAVWQVAFSPDGELVASASWDKTVKLWRLSDGALMRTLGEHASLATSVAFSPDGETVASGSEDKTVKLWRWADGALLRTLEGHPSQLWSVAFSPDGQKLLSGSDDRTVKVWGIQ